MKTFRKFAMMAVAIFATLCLASCSDDDDDASTGFVGIWASLDEEVEDDELFAILIDSNGYTYDGYWNVKTKTFEYEDSRDEPELRWKLVDGGAILYDLESDEQFAVLKIEGGILCSYEGSHVYKYKKVK